MNIYIANIDSGKWAYAMVRQVWDIPGVLAAISGV